MKEKGGGMETEKYVNSLFLHVQHKTVAEMVHKKQQLIKSTMVFKFMNSLQQNPWRCPPSHVHNINYTQYTLDLTDTHSA